MDHPFQFRAGTCDEEIFRAVVQGNEYELPRFFNTTDIILDVGTHIGSFSYACVLRGSCNIHTFETCRENHESARRNLAPVGARVKAHHCAVWRSDRKNETIYFNEYQEVNNASGNVMGAGGTPVKAVGLDRIIRHVTDRGRFRVRLIKMDCEGSEYPILLTAKTLHLVDAIVGEFHNITEEHGPTHPFYRIPENARVAGYDEFNGDVLAEKLRSEGFSVRLERHPIIPRLAGWFFAERPSPAPVADSASRLARLKRKAKRLVGAR
jgi:FkbM family methyltransferase